MIPVVSKSSRRVRREEFSYRQRTNLLGDVMQGCQRFGRIIIDFTDVKLSMPDDVGSDWNLNVMESIGSDARKKLMENIKRASSSPEFWVWAGRHLPITYQQFCERLVRLAESVSPVGQRVRGNSHCNT